MGAIESFVHKWQNQDMVRRRIYLCVCVFFKAIIERNRKCLRMSKKTECIILDGNKPLIIVYCSVAQHVRLFVTQWTEACQASLSISISWNLLKLISIESMIASNHLILCHSPLHLPSIFSSIRVFLNEFLHQVAKLLELQLQHQIIV